ncbi:MAG: peptidase S16 [Betaproteobacteria bacterium]|jgi:Lon protease-like protein|nr:peptidase S16 [Betaproteobacteria bacterium]
MATETLPLFPLSQPVFPEGILRLTIFEVRYLHLIRRCQQEGIAFGVVPLADGHEVQKAGALERLHNIGCLVHLLNVEALQPAVLSVACVGTKRFRLGEHARGAYGLWSGEIIPYPAPARLPIPADLQPLADQLGGLIAAAQRQGEEADIPMRPPYRLDECGWVADRWAELLPLPPAEKAMLLAQDDEVQRLRQISDWLSGTPT